MIKEAMFYSKTENKNVQCFLCPRNCKISPGKFGFCGVRQNQDGKLISLVYGRAVSVAVDPIEKKPLFHFAPGSKALSVATVGCTLRCGFCQNFEIAHSPKIIGEELPPEELLQIAEESHVGGFSWTYTEPTIFFEYYHDTALLAKRKTMKTRSDDSEPLRQTVFYQTWVSNGFTSEDAVKTAAMNLDAINIDLKGNDKFYRETCAGWLEPVQKAIKLYQKLGVWVEITNLIVTNKNDKDEDIKELCQWIFDNVGPDVPLHFSSYYPVFKMKEPPTPAATLEKAFKIAKDVGINYVYLGNVRSPHESTFCPKCNEIVIERKGYNIYNFKLIQKNKNWNCPNCNQKIPMAGMEWSRFGKKRR